MIRPEIQIYHSRATRWRPAAGQRQRCTGLVSRRGCVLGAAAGATQLRRTQVGPSPIRAPAAAGLSRRHCRQQLHYR